MVRSPLMGLTIAATGDFGKERSHENIKRWVEKNGGQWAMKMSEDVTHLLCTKEDYRNKTPMGNAKSLFLVHLRGIDSWPVKHALRLKKFNIVTFDWLEGNLPHYSMNQPAIRQSHNAQTPSQNVSA